MWKQASHDVVDSIGIIQARGIFSSHQSLGNYFAVETSWITLYESQPGSFTEALLKEDTLGLEDLERFVGGG